MKLHAALCLLVLAGCATVPSLKRTDDAHLSEGGGSPAGSPAELTEPVRLETRAGTFLVSPEHAEDFQKVLAGEPTARPFFAGSTLDASTD